MSKIRARNYDYDPLIFLRCHSKTDRDFADVKTQVWQAVFEPINKSKTVATCGGNQVCIIDVRSQEVDQRYTADSNEIFYALAWGIIETVYMEELVPILVAGGVRNIIYFMYPKRKIILTQFALEKTKKKHISGLLFHPKNSKILFCSLNSGEVHILHLEVDADYMLKVTANVVLNAETEIFSISYCRSLDILFSATESGLVGWFLEDCEDKTINHSLLRFRLPISPRSPNSKSFDLVDSVEAMKNSLIAVKCYLHGCIYICNLHDVKSKYENSCLIDVEPVYKLKWSPTDNYFMGISVNYEKGLLTCGDDQGSIWIYDINAIKNNPLPKECQEINPVKIIEWPIVEDKFIAKSRKLNVDVYDIVIAKATIHRKGKYIVAVTNNNTVCLWKLTSKK